MEEYRGSMGLAAGDFDRDGDDDLFISHWIAQGFALYQNLLEEQRGMSGNRTPFHGCGGYKWDWAAFHATGWMGCELRRLRLRRLARPYRR